VLLAAGADPVATNNKGQKPIDVANAFEVEVLLASAENGPLYKTAFLDAAENGELAKVKIAVEFDKLDPNCSDVSAATSFCVFLITP